MRELGLILCLVLPGVLGNAAEYSRPIRNAVEEIRRDVTPEGIPCLRGHMLNYGGSSGAFATYFPKVYGNATQTDIEKMLKDSSPAVRLLGAAVAINQGRPASFLEALVHDSEKIRVGPVEREVEEFQNRTVAQVLAEMQHDPQFLLRITYGAEVRFAYFKQVKGGVGAHVVLGQLPPYPTDMARAGINGKVIARLLFSKGAASPEIQITQSSHAEFAEAVAWALSKWKLHGESSGDSSADAVEFECQLIFVATE